MYVHLTRIYFPEWCVSYAPLFCPPVMALLVELRCQERNGVERVPEVRAFPVRELRVIRWPGEGCEHMEWGKSTRQQLEHLVLILSFFQVLLSYQ